MRFIACFVCLMFGCEILAEAKYIKKFVTYNTSRNEGGDDEVFMVGSYVVFEGEDASGRNQIYVFKGSGSNVKITQPGSSSSFGSAYIQNVDGSYVVFRGKIGSSWGKYLHDISSGETIEPAYETGYNHYVSGFSVFYNVHHGGSGHYNCYRYDIKSGTNELISPEPTSSKFDISSASQLYKGSVVWSATSTSGVKNIYYYDGSSTVTVTNGSFSGLGLSSNVVAMSDGADVLLYDIVGGGITRADVESTLKYDVIPGWTNTIYHGVFNQMSNDGYVMDVDFYYSGHSKDNPAVSGVDSSELSSGLYKACKGKASQDSQICFLSGFTNLVVVSDYRYKEDGTVHFDSAFLDTVYTNVTTESFSSYTAPNGYTDGEGLLPERWCRHDMEPSAGDGIIAYHAYGVYKASGGAIADMDEVVVYHVEEDKHYGMYMEDSRTSYRGGNWAKCDRSNKNVAWTSHDTFGGPTDDEVCVAYWVGPKACLVDVDLSGENLSGVDFRGSDLARADLSGADLSGANLADAILTDTVFSNALYDSSTVIPLSFSPESHGMIHESPGSFSTAITSIGPAGIAYSNSVSNLYVGIEYAQSLAGDWSRSDASELMKFETNNVGVFPLPLEDIEFPHLFFRTEVSDRLGDDWTAYSNDVIRFVSTDYIDLGGINYISKFRSGLGHDYVDGFEACRSMKHYYHPGISNWADLNIYSPVDGTILDVTYESSGARVMIKSSDYPAYKFILFHVDVDPSITSGAAVLAGERIGTHIGNQTMSDIAVRVSTIHSNQPALRLVSYFDVMTDELFSDYISRGVSLRSDLIISAEERDADPITCDGETFVAPESAPGGGYGSISNKFHLSSP